MVNHRRLTHINQYALINMDQPRSSTFHTSQCLSCPALFAYPAIYGLSGDTKVICHLFWRHFIK